MSSEQYRCWSPDFGEDEDSSSLIRAYDLEDAVRDYANIAYNDGGFQTLTVHVRGTFGELRAYSISAEPTVSFVANEVRV